jgi:hypothetical protein
MGRFVKFIGEYRIDNADNNTTEYRRVFNESTQISEYLALKVNIPANTMDFEIPLTGLSPNDIRKVYLSTNIEVQVKINGIVGPSFSMLSTTVIGGKLSNSSIYITTGVDAACVEVSAASV